MPPINITNPWGKGVGTDGDSAGAMDAQRTDLWQLDLQAVVARITSALRSSNNLYYDAMPDPGSARYYARSVDIPGLTVEGVVVMRDTLPYTMPGADKAPAPVTVTFLVDTPTPAPYLGSKLITLLYSWRALVRAGRGAFDGGFSPSNTSFEISFGLADAADKGSLQPNYRFDVPFNLLQGDTPVNRGSLINIVNQQNVTSTGGGGAIPVGYQYSTSLMLRQMWLADFKISPFKYEGSSLAEITATFHCTSVVPVAAPF